MPTSPARLLALPLALTALLTAGCTSDDGGTERVPEGRNGSQAPGFPPPGLPTDPAVVPTVVADPTQSAGTTVGPTTTPSFSGQDKSGGSGS
jgi:hypothetical protein